MKKVQVSSGVFVEVSRETEAKAKKAFAEVSFSRSAVSRMARMDYRIGRIGTLIGPRKKKAKTERTDSMVAA